MPAVRFFNCCRGAVRPADWNATLGGLARLGSPATVHSDGLRNGAAEHHALCHLDVPDD